MMIKAVERPIRVHGTCDAAAWPLCLTCAGGPGTFLQLEPRRTRRTDGRTDVSRQKLVRRNLSRLLQLQTLVLLVRPVLHLHVYACLWTF